MRVFRILDKKKKLPSTSCSSVYPSFTSGQDIEQYGFGGSINRTKVMERLGIVSPQECLAIDDLLNRSYCENVSPNSHGDVWLEETLEEDDLGNDGADQESITSLCLDMEASAPKFELPRRGGGPHLQQGPLDAAAKMSFLQERGTCTQHWGPKLLKFQCFAADMSIMLESANWLSKSAKPLSSPGTFPLPLPTQEKHYLPSPQSYAIKEASPTENLPMAHPLPQPPLLAASISCQHTPVSSCTLHPSQFKCRTAHLLSPSETTPNQPHPQPRFKALQRSPSSPSPSSPPPSSRKQSPRSRHRLPSQSLACGSSGRSAMMGMNYPARSPPPKAHCLNKWRKGAILGQGTFGIVYEGLNLEDGSFFAVKVSSSMDVSPEIQQEVDLLSKLEHPNIVHYLGSSIEEGRLCIFLELVRMGSLETIVRKYKRFEDNTIRRYTRQILLGLAYLHAKKTIHRDIKCANILVDVNGQVKLSDFGVAKQVDEALFSSSKGTPLFMAPEVLTPKKNCYSFSADIWSLGCTILEMADGKPPWSDLEGFGFLFKVKSGELPPISEHLSPEGKDFVCRCLRFHAKDRPTAPELLQHPFVANAQSLEPLITCTSPSSNESPQTSFISLNSWRREGGHLPIVA